MASSEVDALAYQVLKWCAANQYPIADFVHALEKRLEFWADEDTCNRCGGNFRGHVEASHNFQPGLRDKERRT